MTYAKQDTTSTNSLNSKLGKAIPKPKAKTKRKAKPPTLASRIRILREQGYKASQIAAMIGCDVQCVYNQNYHDKKQQELKPFKQKAALERHQKDLEAANEFLRLQRAENFAPMKPELQNVKVQYVGPEPKLSFKQRLRVLFTGVV